jgi:hypothetical protein
VLHLSPSWRIYRHETIGEGEGCFGGRRARRFIGFFPPSHRSLKSRGSLASFPVGGAARARLVLVNLEACPPGYLGLLPAPPAALLQLRHSLLD